MTLEVSPRAVLDAERAARWWRQNRPAAASRFEEELRSVLGEIDRTPELGTVYRAVSGREHRRILMRETRHHVYYRIVAPSLVRIVAIWGAQRARGPRL